MTATFTDRLVLALKRLDKSPYWLSQQTGIGESTVRNWVPSEKGSRRVSFPSLEVLPMLAEVLDVRLEWLIAGKGEMPATPGGLEEAPGGYWAGPDTYEQALDEAERELMARQDAPFDPLSVPEDAKHIQRTLELVATSSTDPKLKGRADYLLSRGFGDAQATERVAERGRAATDRIREAGQSVRRSLESLGWSAAPLGVVEAMKTLAYAYRIPEDDIVMALGMIKAEWDARFPN